jgi:hypothetical protein
MDSHVSQPQASCDAVDPHRYVVAGPVKSADIGGVTCPLALSRHEAVMSVARWPYGQVMAAYRALAVETPHGRVAFDLALAVVQGEVQIQWWRTYVGGDLPTCFTINQRARLSEARRSIEEAAVMSEHEQAAGNPAAVKKVAKAKSAGPKKVAKAKSTGPKKETKPKSAGPRGPRRDYEHTAITMIAKENPCREGTEAARLFDTAAGSKTVADYLAAAEKKSKRVNAQWHLFNFQRRGALKLRGPEPRGTAA